MSISEEENKRTITVVIPINLKTLITDVLSATSQLIVETTIGNILLQFPKMDYHARRKLKSELFDYLRPYVLSDKAPNSKGIEIWAEGYRATGESSGAQKVGRAEGETLKIACINYADTHPEFNKLFDQHEMTYWGCRLFDNEEDARKSFG